MFERILEDIRTIKERDPACKGSLEVLIAYPGFHAVQFWRFSHWCWIQGWFTFARWVSHVARFLTGIEIHPGARIGRRVFIDHGMGTVIGETAEVGDDCTIYQGVTLGGTSLGRGEKRHPTLEEGVIVGAGAKVLGGWTVGRNARIGSNAVCLKPIAAETTVVGVPGHVAGEKRKAQEAEHSRFSAYGVVRGAEDPISRAFVQVKRELDAQRSTINALRLELEKLRGADASRIPPLEDPKEQSFLDSAL